MTLKPILVRCCTVVLLTFYSSFGEAQDLQLADSPPEAVLETLDSEDFDVSLLNRRLRDEAGMSDEQARVWIERRVRSVLRGNEAELTAQNDGGAKSPSFVGVETQDGKTLQMSVDGQNRGVLASGNRVFVIAPKEELRKVQELVTTLEQFGIRQVVIKTLVLRDSVATMKKMPIHWSLVEAVSKIAQSKGAEVRTAAFDQAKTLPAIEQSTAGLFMQRQQPQTTAGLFMQRQQPQPTEDLPAPQGVTSATWTEATSIVERATPVLYTLLTPEEYQSVLKHVKQVPSTERVMSPTVVVFNGQIATISDSVERPFVTGIEPMLIGSDEAKQVEFAPSIKVYPEGTTLKLQPELFQGKRVRLNCQLDMCKVRSVETIAIDGVAGQADFTVQMPEVASTQFRTCLEMPINYALAINAFELGEDGEKQSIVVLCHCSLRDVEPARRK